MKIKLIAILAIVGLMGAGCGQSKQEQYQACLDKQKTRAQAHADCVQGKLKAKGYTDGLTCIGNYQNPVCQDTARYNAEIEAANECDQMIPLAPSTVECLEIVK